MPGRVTAMKRMVFAIAASLLFSMAAQASGGFSCRSHEKDPVKLVVEGATPRSEPGLLNFGGLVEFDGKKLELRKADVTSFLGKNGIIRVRVTARAGGETFAVRVDVKRNPADEDEWPGTYEIAPAGTKDKALIRRGSVQCFVE